MRDAEGFGCYQQNAIAPCPGVDLIPVFDDLSIDWQGRISCLDRVGEYHDVAVLDELQCDLARRCEDSIYPGPKARIEIDPGPQHFKVPEPQGAPVQIDNNTIDRKRWLQKLIFDDVTTDRGIQTCDGLVIRLGYRILVAKSSRRESGQ